MIPLSECSLRNKNAFREGVVELERCGGELLEDFRGFMAEARRELPCP